MAKDLAREIGYIYIDSGAMYRAVTLYCIEQGLFDEAGNIDEETLKAHMNDIHISFQLNPETQRPVTYLNGVNVEDRIRSLEVSSHVSPVAALGFVREALVKQQQEMGKEKGRTRHRNRRFPGSRTEDIRYRFGRNPCPTPIR